MEDLYSNTLLEGINHQSKNEILLRFKKHNFKEQDIISYDYYGKKLLVLEVNSNVVICEILNQESFVENIFLNLATKYYSIKN